MKLVVTKTYGKLWVTRMKHGHMIVNIFMCTGYYASYVNQLSNLWAMTQPMTQIT